MLGNDPEARSGWIGRALVLVAALGGLLLAGIGLRALSRPFGGDDLDAVRTIADDRSGGLTAAAHAVSWFGRLWVLLVLAAIVTVVRSRWRGWALDPTVIVAVLGAWVLQNLVKVVVDRPRPPVAHLEHVTSASFPSGHATQSAAFAVAVWLALAAGSPARWVRLASAFAACVAVAAIALSRVYLGVHYPSDVVAGALLGASWAAIAALVLRRRPASGCQT